MQFHHCRRLVQVSIAGSMIVALLLSNSAYSLARSSTSGHQCAPLSITRTANAHGGEIYAITALSADDIWAVGSSGFGQTLIEHWNGHHWNISPAHDTKGDVDVLSSVSGSGPKDVWAAGTAGPPGLIEHWNGKSWHISYMPNFVPGAHTYVIDILAISPKDAWAVGNTGGGGPDQFILHWNGKSWKVWPGSRLDNDFLYSLSAVNAHNIWAVGTTLDHGPLAEHWNGKEWSLVKTVPVSSSFDDSEFSDVVAISRGDVWAVGSDSGYSFASITEHWNGHSWTLVKNHAPESMLNSVSADGPDDIWAVGDTWAPLKNGGSTMDKTMMLHWNGQSWRRVPDAKTPRHADSSILALSHHYVWAVGGWGTTARSLRWNGRTWKRQWVPNPSWATRRFQVSWHLRVPMYWLWECSRTQSTDRPRQLPSSGMDLSGL